jgi:HAD superfamily hydrolase (TIGR01490 family)
MSSTLNASNAPSHSSRGVAAFFDVDGTLLPSPSLESRFFRALRHQRAIPRANYLLWLGNAVRLARISAAVARHANKMYLRGVSIDAANRFAAPSAPPPFLSPLFAAALNRLAWHAARSHRIYLVTGALEPLVSTLAKEITILLASRGLPVSVEVCATKLEHHDGRWTGGVLGTAMFGEQKARTLWRLAADEHIDLARSYAYGDSANDRWMLGAVGKPVVVNPLRDMKRIAELRKWPVLHWSERPARATRAAAYVHRAITNSNSQTPA